MRGPIVVLSIPTSPFGAAVVATLVALGHEATTLSLDAAIDGAPVTIDANAVMWQGVDLLGASAVLIETPLFAWPQPQRVVERVAAGAALQEAAIADRESRSLTQSALLVAASQVPVVNAPALATLAASPAIAVELLEALDFPVCSWRLGTERSLTHDVAGRDRWHRPARSRAGEPGRGFDAGEHEILVALVIGTRVVSARRFASVAAWADQADARTLAREDLPASAADLASRAPATLGLDLAAIAIVNGPSPQILDVEAGPDLAAWDAALNGQVADALADHLVTVSSAAQATRPQAPNPTRRGTP